MDMTEWLRGLGLEQYAPAFRDHDIDAKILSRLTGEDLLQLGVTSVGHRRRLLEAMASFLGPAEEGERRQLTMMFCDLVGSTALSTALDPEDLREIIGGYHHASLEPSRASMALFRQYMGDGVLVYFGYPQAHEDDAERAVRSGLALVEAVGEVKAPKLCKCVSASPQGLS